MNKQETTSDVSIIIVSFNTKELTKNCINALYEKTQDLNYDVWVVDNASKDGSAEMIKSEFPQVKLIESGENLGFGKANNLAITKSEAKYCFLLNSDTILLNNAVKILFDFMEKPENNLVAACGGNLYDEELKPTTSFGRLPDIESLLIRHTALKLVFPKQNKQIKNYEQSIDRTQEQEVGYISGADLMLRKSALAHTGAFDEKFFLYYEETELQHRIKKNGYKIYFVPEAQIVHLEGKSEISANKALIVNRSRCLYYSLSYGRFWGILIGILFIPNYLKVLRRSLFKAYKQSIKSV